MAGPLLEVEDLQTSFFVGNKVYQAVDGVSFTLFPGETLALVGESGSGKSVTASSILQIVPNPPGKIVGGRVCYRRENLLEKTAEEMRALRGDHISMIFQEPMTSLNPVFRIGEQIEEAILLHRHPLDPQTNKPLTRKALKAYARAQTIEMLTSVGIPDAQARLRDFPHQLSGGMRQRVMIAMALVCQPDVLIADEPTSALDVTVQAQILSLLRRAREDFGTAILLITHDFGVVAENSDRVAVMYAGQIVETADVRAIFAHPLHPYTHGLLASIPRLDVNTDRLPVIAGTVPDSSRFPAGCRFAPRCQQAQERCRREAPQLHSLDALQGHQDTGHKVRCHFPGAFAHFTGEYVHVP